MTKHTPSLTAVSEASALLNSSRARLEAEAEVWVSAQLEPYQRDLVRSVVTASEAGNSVVDIARAYTETGKTPNRNAIYRILENNPEEPNALPLDWVPRVVKTATGTRTVYDVSGTLYLFGPSGITGGFVWRYDTVTHELEPSSFSDEPYPYEDSYYRGALDRWVNNNPYPEGE